MKLLTLYGVGIITGLLFAYGLRGLYENYRNLRYGDVCPFCGRKSAR